MAGRRGQSQRARTSALALASLVAFACGGRVDGESGQGAAGAGTASAGETLITLASGQENPSGLAVDSTGVYWTTGSHTVVTTQSVPTDGKVTRANLDGTDIMAVATGQAIPGPIGVANALVAWADLASIMLFAPGGRAAAAASAHDVYAVATDGDNVYWTAPTGLSSVPVSGGGIAMLAGGTPASGSIGLDADSVYWASSVGVMRVPKTNANPVTLAATTSATAVAVDATDVYWIDSSAAAIFRVPISGGTPTMVVSSPPNLAALAVDGINVYWTSYSAGTVSKVPVDGGPVVTLASAQSFPTNIAVDSTSVYWTNANGYNGQIQKLTPK